ncbi:hypothetical protein ACFJGV_09845 [Cnuibacter sp. UC19_7]|uniref:hypothetical protein n=1 Tax=Cnuibacter sp. UC19_7 TaxID=3350166 RepID=UPI00366A8571
MSDDELPRPWWRVLGEWLTEQKLWRDVLTRVIAGVITAAVVYAGAVLLGYLHTPEIAAGALLALGIAGVLILVAVAAGLLTSLPSRRRAGRPVVGHTVAAVVLLAAAVGVAVGVGGTVFASGAPL